jgi:outer membrane protein OmpA-like peptidoglycan-associated protein
VLFAFNSADLQPEGRQLLKSLAGAADRLPGITR